MTALPWHRRHALQLAAQLPDGPDDAKIILALTNQILADFLDQPEPVQAATVIKLVDARGEGGVA